MQTAGRFGRDGEHLTQTDHGTHARLQVGKLLSDVADDAHEGAGDQEQRHDLRDRQRSAVGEQDTGDRDDRQQTVQQQDGAQRDATFEQDDVVEEFVDPGRQLREPADRERLAEAGAQVVASGDALLEGGGVVGPGGFLDHLALGDLAHQRTHHQQRQPGEDREQQPGRPPGETGHQPHRDEREHRAQHHPDLHPDE